MALSNIFGKTGSASLYDKALGSEYDIVRRVHDSIDKIELVAQYVSGVGSSGDIIVDGENLSGPLRYAADNFVSLEGRVTAIETELDSLSITVSAINLAVTQSDGQLRALISQETAARTDATDALASSISSVLARVDLAEGNLASIQAALSTEQTVRADADAVFETSVTTLTARVDAAETGVSAAQAAIVNEQNTRASAVSSLSSSLSSLTARVTSAEGGISQSQAAIQNEQIARAAADLALTNEVTELTSRVTNAEDSVQLAQANLAAEQTTRATADSALASSINLLSAEVTTVKEGRSGQLIFNGTFSAGRSGWIVPYTGSGSISPTPMVHRTNWNGAADALTNTSGIRRDAATEFPVRVLSGTKIKLRVEYYLSAACTLEIRQVGRSLDGTNTQLFDTILTTMSSGPFGSWQVFEQLIEYTQDADVFYGALTNTTAVAGAQVGIRLITAMDMTSAELARNQAEIATTAATQASDSAASATTSQILAASSASSAVDSAGAANTSASNAATSATSASNSAASASNSAVLAANVGTGALNPNASFDDFPSGDVGALPNNWVSGADSSLGYRVSDGNGGYAWRLPSPANIETYVYSQSGYGAVKQNDWFVLEADVILNSGSLSGAGVLFRVWDVGSGNFQDITLVFSVDKDSSNQVIGNGVAGRTYRYRKLVQVTIANADYYQLWTMSHWDVLGSLSSAIDITWLKNALRPATQAEIDAGTVLPAVQATVTTNSAAIATLEGATAHYETIVAADGSNPAMVQLKAGKNGSKIGLVADKIALGNSVDGIIQYVLSIEGGQARLNNALIRNLQVAPRADSQIFLPVTLQPLVRLAKDGDAVLYQNGDSFGAAPQRITGDVTSLPALAPGSRYEAKALNITATGFDASVKVISSTTLTNQTSATGTNVGETPQWRTHKPVADDAYDGNYQYRFDVSIPRTSLTQLDIDPVLGRYFSATYRGTFNLYYHNGSTYVIARTVTVERLVEGWYAGTSQPAATMTLNNESHVANITANIPLTANQEFGIHAVSGTITGFDFVKYTSESSGTTTSVTTDIPWTIFPPLPV